MSVAEALFRERAHTVRAYHRLGDTERLSATEESKVAERRCWTGPTELGVCHESSSQSMHNEVDYTTRPRKDQRLADADAPLKERDGGWVH